ncbi:hypothetical protein H9P43_004165 [Blastocladiella emersonii ATCC 22665]|nr:hypothetical protein H9P43_004165 [Blastocladiella emersonii ATCC 22665]
MPTASSSDESTPILGRRRGSTHDDVEPEAEAAADLSSCKGLGALLTAHTLETWTSRTWEFAWPIWLALLVPDSLAPLSIYGIAICLGAMLYGGRIGAMLDHPRLTRWDAVRGAVVIAKLAMVLACSMLLVWFEVEQNPDGWIARHAVPFLPSNDMARKGVLMAPMVVAGLLIKWANTAYVITVERDWVVVITHGNPLNLAWTNGWVRRIDLLCKLLAPLVIASLIAALPPRVTVFGLGAFAIVDMALELVLFASVRRHYRALSLSKHAAAAPAPLFASAPDSAITDYGGAVNGDEDDAVTLTAPTHEPTADPRSPLARYLRHPILLASLAMASLYITVLSFGGQMIAYLATEAHLPAPAIAGYRSVAAFAGVVATWIAPALITRWGPVRVGLWSIWAQTASLVPVAVFLVLETAGGVTPDSAMMRTQVLCGCVAVSRVFLWTFDLAHSQVMQESVAAHEVGAINGVHYAVCAAGDLITYILTLVWWSPADFPLPMLVSVACVAMGAVWWSAYVLKVRHHLIHWERVPFLWKQLALRYSQPH